MEMLLDLWLPILLSTLAVWFAGAAFWMLLPHHQKDMGPVPGEDAFIASLKGLDVKPGEYSFPYCSSKEDYKDPEFIKKWKEGPAGFMTVLAPVSMGRNMALSILVYFVVSVFTAYVGAETLPAGTSFAKVFQVLATVGVMTYTFGWMPNAIWFGKTRRSIVTNAIDGIVYGFIMGAIFAALWPSAPVVA